MVLIHSHIQQCAWASFHNPTHVYAHTKQKAWQDSFQKAFSMWSVSAVKGISKSDLKMLLISLFIYRPMAVLHPETHLLYMTYLQDKNQSIRNTNSNKNNYAMASHSLSLRHFYFAPELLNCQGFLIIFFFQTYKHVQQRDCILYP